MHVALGCGNPNDIGYVVVVVVVVVNPYGGGWSCSEIINQNYIG